MTVLVVIEAVALALLTLLVAGLLRSHLEILRVLREMDPPPTAAPASASARAAGSAAGPGDIGGAVPGGNGAVAVVRLAGMPRPTLLAFLSSVCLTCNTFWETFADPNLALPDGARLVVVTMGPEAENEMALARLAPEGATVVMSSDAWAAYHVPGAPYFALVDGVSGSVAAEGTAADWSGALGVLLAGAPLDLQG